MNRPEHHIPVPASRRPFAAHMEYRRSRTEVESIVTGLLLGLIFVALLVVCLLLAFGVVR